MAATLAVALTLVAPTMVAPSAGASGPASPTPLERAVADAPGPVGPVPTVDPDPAAGPYEPGFVDEPVPGNLPSPALDDIPVSSAELDSVSGVLADAEQRRDGAIDHLADVRAHIADLGVQRVEAEVELGERRATEAQRGDERAAAVQVHLERISDVEDAERRLGRARDHLRELVVAAYVTEARDLSDALAPFSADTDVDAALLRLGYGDASSASRVRDVEQRLDELAAAEAARDEAAAARAAAEQAELDAIAAREATEDHITAIEAERVQAEADEVAAVDTLAAREVDVVEAAADIAPARLRADVIGDGIDFPLVALDAWVKASASAPCRVEWWMLAGISKVEGRHGTHGGGRLGARGYPSTRIVGPALDGSGGNARIGDTDGGVFDGDVVFDRAVGPMQFIPSTWRFWGRDGDGDGVNDPNTIYDAAAAAAAYLCHGRTDLNDEAQLRAAYFSYNHAGWYVERVLRAARGYQAAVTVPPHVPDDHTGDI